MFMMVTHLAPHTANEFDPMQAPEDVINKFSYISDRKRRIYSAMVTKLDESVGKIVKTLDENEMLDNSVILFLSDNGSPVLGNNNLLFSAKVWFSSFFFLFLNFLGEHSNAGSNFPFKGVSSFREYRCLS